MKIPLSLLLEEAVQKLKIAGVFSPEVDARLLVTFVTGYSRAEMIMYPSRQLSQTHALAIRELVQKRAERIPLQHLLGTVEWGGLELKTDARALIPRPETEILLELATSRIGAACKVLDIGTGTGALALGIKKKHMGAVVWASDISTEAIALAKENAELNNLEIHFVHADICKGIEEQFDVIVSNPPYLPSGDALTAQPEICHDPRLSLYSGQDGLLVARRLVHEVSRLLKPGGVLLLELDPRNIDTLAGEMPDTYAGIEKFSDLTGRTRFLSALKNQ